MRQSSKNPPIKDRLEFKDILALAAWAGMVVGFLEGIILNWMRMYPVILAPYKVSAHVLWVAPIVDFLFFVAMGCGLYGLFCVLRYQFAISQHLLAQGIFLFLGFVTLLTATVSLHPLAAVTLSAGLTTLLCRSIKGAEVSITFGLRKRILLVPLFIVFSVGSVFGYERLDEGWRFDRLNIAQEASTNVLVIVMDTVRFDSFVDSGHRANTPNLDRITSKGMKFDNAWATSSWSLPSQASILTGQYPHQHGADWPELALRDDSPTLAEFFSKLGYVTGAFSGNSAWITPEYLGDGFLRFEVYTLEDIFRRTVWGRKISRVFWEFGNHIAGRGKKAHSVNNQFLTFLDDYPGSYFFAYLCYMDVNQIFHFQKFNKWFWEPKVSSYEVFEAYKHGLELLDRQIGILFKDLEERGILDNTLVVITSDHGESFGSEIQIDHDPEGHGSSLYPEQARVPLFLLFPKGNVSEETLTHTVSIHQIPATITHFLGLKDSPFPGPVLGANLFHETDNEVSTDGAALLTLNYETNNYQSAVFNNWQYIKNINNKQQSEELFDLRSDPLAKRNLTESQSRNILMRGLVERLLNQG